MSEPDMPKTTRKKPWVLTFFGLLAASDLLAMPFFVGAPDAAKMPDMVRFLGHFHPVFLHLPIGVFALIILQELWLMVRKKGGASDDASLYPLFLVQSVRGSLLFWGSYFIMAKLNSAKASWSSNTCGQACFSRLLRC